MACTLRVAVATAKLGLPELKLGLIPGYGGTQRLPQLVGRGRALELMLTGDRIDAEAACRIGLGESDSSGRIVAGRARVMLLERFLPTVPWRLRLRWKRWTSDSTVGLEEGLRFESSAFGLAASTEDRHEGTKAFFERRPPVFTGR